MAIIERDDDLRERTLELYESGLPPGDSTGFRSVDKFYTVAPQQWTLITGYPGSGKSEWLDDVLVNLATNHGWEFAFFSPENYPTETHVAKLTEKHLHKPFAAGPNERMGLIELDQAIDWVQQRFTWLKPDVTDYRTLFASAAPWHPPAPRKYGLVLDPWNALEHKRPRDLTETEYIGAALTEVTNWCRAHNMHIFLVAHPSKMGRDPTTGQRPVPTPYDIAGSANWYNKADNILCVHRDQAAGTQQVKIHIQKVRFKHIGRIGEADLIYDRVTGRYADDPYHRSIENF